MIIIGVNGHAGAGKTTFSSLIFENKKKKIIHLDVLFFNLKKSVFKNCSTQYEKNNGEVAAYLDKDSNLYNILSMKYVEHLYTKIKAIIARKMIYKAITQYSKEDFDYLILEGNMLDIYSLDKFCDIKVYIHSDVKTRYKRVIKRDKNGLNSNVDIIDTFNYESKRKINLKDYIILDNCSSFDQFKKNINSLENTLKNKQNKVKYKK